MSALPAEGLDPVLPIVPAAEATSRGLLTVRELAAHYGVDRATITYLLGRPHAPAPVGLTDWGSRGQRWPLYDRDGFQRWADSNEGPRNGAIGSRRRGSPVRIIGTRTPTASRPYVWRDPIRQHTTRPR